MKRRYLQYLRCPYTGSELDVGGFPAASDGASFGIATSEAGRFPIVAGILRLLADELRDPLVALIESGRHEAALAAALDVPFLNRRDTVLQGLWRRWLRRTRLDSVAHARGPGKSRIRQLATGADAFSVATAATGAVAWAGWQTYRFSMPTFLPVYPLVHLARGRRAIFDFGCGLGQSSFLLDRVAPDADIVCGDYSFTAMYLAKRYFVPQATCICLDGDYPLPFVNGCFDHVFSTDALQYIGPKAGLAREFQRILTADGTIALAHLHNRLSPERGCTGTGLTPPGYRGLFDGMVRRLFPEAAIVADYVADGALNLEREYDVEDPGQWMSGVSLVAAASSDQLRNLSGLLEDAVARAREPRVNPLYAATRSGQGWLLERRVGEPYAFERTISGYELLPKRILLETPSLDSAALLALRDRVGGGDLRDLMRRFVVLDLPSRFLPPGTGA